MRNTKNIFMSKTLAGLLSLASVFVTAAPVYAEDTTNTLVKSAVCESNNNDILVDSRLKEFDNLDKVGKYLNFDAKVPDYIGKNSTVLGINVVKDKGVNYLELSFNSESDSIYNMNYLYEFSGNITDNIKDIRYGNASNVSNVQVSIEEKKLGSIDGKYIIITGELIRNNNLASKETSKYFLFTKDGVNYVVNTADFKDEDNLNTEINKIAPSLKSSCDIKSVKYDVKKLDDKSYNLDVYDKDDFNKAVEYLGYKPKFVTRINDDVKIDCCDVFHDDLYGDNITTFQCNYSYKNSGLIVFIQEKGNDNYKYNEIAKNGYFIEKDFVDNKTTEAPVEKLNWDNVNVYKYFDKYDNKCVYQWKVGDMYYFFETYFHGEKENVDDIVKVLFEA